jgi:hypothetical protein
MLIIKEIIPPFPLRLDVAFMSYTHGKEGERMTAHAEPDFSPYTIFQYITLFWRKLKDFSGYLRASMIYHVPRKMCNLSMNLFDKTCQHLFGFYELSKKKKKNLVLHTVIFYFGWSLKLSKFVLGPQTTKIIEKMLFLNNSSKKEKCYF